MSLAGRTVLVTRPVEDAAAWIREIEQRGGRAVALPCLETAPETGPEVAGRLREALEEAAVLALTSRRGVEATAALLAGPPPPHVRIAAVGPETARAAREILGRVDLVAREGTGASLAADLAERVAEWSLGESPALVVAAADRAGRQLEETLEPRGWRVTRIPVYRTVPAPEREKKENLAAWGVNVILLASPSAVEGLLHVAQIPPGAALISIGPSTTAAARGFGLAVAAEARRPGLDELLEAIP